MDLRNPNYLQLVLNRIMAEHLNKTISDFTRIGVNIQTTRVLVALRCHEALRSGVLAYLVGMEQTAISHLLKNLTKDGLITRDRNEHDNRAVEVRLTPKGKELADYCHAAAVRQEALLLQGLSAKEVKLLREIVWRMDENVRGRPRSEGRKVAAASKEKSAAATADLAE